jgi:hypothetical protein
MSEVTQTLPEFLRRNVAGRFSEMVAKAEQRLMQAKREVEDLQAANGTIGWEIGDSEPIRWFVNLAGGQMTVSEQSASEPFVIVALSVPDWERFVGGAAAGGLFAGNDQRPLGKARIERVRAIKGSIRFVLTDLPSYGDFTATVHFGGERSPEPKATIQMPVDVAQKIQTGALNPQAAFMQGQMKLIGDMGFAMQLGIALLL